MASFKDVPKRFLIFIILIYLFFWSSSILWYTVKINLLFPTTWALIKSVTVNLMISSLRWIFVFSNSCPTYIKSFSKKINIYPSIQETIFVFNIEYLIIFASLNGTYCFLSIVYSILNKLMLKISIYFLNYLSLSLYGSIFYFNFLFKIV